MPENTNYMIAAYTIAAVLYGGYAAYLIAKGKKL